LPRGASIEFWRNLCANLWAIVQNGCALRVATDSADRPQSHALIDFAHVADRMAAHRRFFPNSNVIAFSRSSRGDGVIDELYDLIGGRPTVQAATELFYKKVQADETLQPFFGNANMEQLLARQSMFISMLLGGRTVYTGADLAAAHARARKQGLNDGHFDRFMKHFREALKEVGVEAEKSDKVVKLLESRRGAVLNPS
jgi:hemoglobin